MLYRSVLIIIALSFACSQTAWCQSASRLWTDKSGRFKINAKLLERNSSQIKLQKDDGRVITVPLSALSDTDTTYLKSLDEESENPFAGGELMDKSAAASPESSNSTKSQAAPFPVLGETKELTGNGLLISIQMEEPLSAIQPDPPRASIDFAPFARQLEPLDAYARVSPPILVNPQGPVFAVSAHRNGNAVSPANFGHVFLVDKESRQPNLVYTSDETFSLLDHQLDFDRSIGMIGVTSPSDRGGDLAVMDGLSTGNPRVIARWHLPEWQKPGFKPKAEMAKMLDANRAIVQVNHSVYCWSLDDGRCHFKIDRVPATGKVTTSANGRYLAVSVSGGTQIIDVDKGELLGKIPFSGNLTPEVRFCPSGVRLAMVAGNQFAIWNLQSAGMEMEETIASTLGRLVGWVGDQSLLTQFVLIDLDLGRGVWKYHLSSGAKERTVPGGYLFVDKNSKPASLVSLPVPHGTIANVKRQLQNVGSEMLLLGPGAQVSLKVSGIAGVDEQVMEKALREAVERTGWQVADRANINVVATITRGEKQKLNFRKMGTSIRSPGETVTLKPYRASLKVVRGSETLWESSSQNMVPFLIRLQGGETVQKAVKRYEKADPEYFKRVRIPPQIFKPEYNKIVGRSRINQGQWLDF